MTTIKPKDLEGLVWLTTAEAAVYSRRTPKTVRDSLNEGTLVGSQPSGDGSHWRIHRDDLDAWLRGESA